MFKKWPKTLRWENETFTITEKIDGTNACVVILPDKRYKDGYNIFAQSRTRIITPKDDNYGFAAFVKAHQNELLALGAGYHYGEWWGQGINRNYGLKERRFSLFDVNRYLEVELPSCCHLVPLIKDVIDLPIDLSEVDTFVDYVVDNMQTSGSIAVPGFINPEGIIVQSNLYPSMRYKYIISK